MSALINSSVWIEYFRNSSNHEKVDFLSNENQVVINHLILAELTPFLKTRKHNSLVDLLHNISRLELDIK